MGLAIHIVYMLWFMGIGLPIVGLLKLADWKGFVHAYSMYDLIAMKVKFYAWIYPLLEVGIGAVFLNHLLFPSGISYTLVIAAAWVLLILMTIGAIGVTKNLMSKNPVKCACLGTLIKVPLTKFTLIENVVMAIMALMIILL